MKKIHSVVATLALVSLCAACSTTSSATKQEAGTSKITVGVFEGLTSPVFSGMQQGSFDKLDLTTVNVESGPASLSLMKSGSVDIVADVAAGAVAVAAATGGEIKVVWDGYQSKSAIVGRGISSPDDLKGKTIGTASGSTSDFALAQYLETNGLTDDVKLLNLPAGSMPAALKTGQIDAASIWDPVISALLEVPGATVLDEQQVDAWDIVSADFAEKNPEAVQRWVCSRADAADKYIEKPKAAQQALADATKQDLDQVAALLPASSVFNAEQQSALLSTDAAEYVAKLGEWLAAEKRIDSAPAVAQVMPLFDASFAQKVVDGECEK